MRDFPYYSPPFSGIREQGSRVLKWQAKERRRALFYISEMNTNPLLFSHSAQTGGAHPCLNGTQIAPFTALFLTGVQQGGTVIDG